MAVIRDIARQIIAKHQLKQADADHFVQMMVEVIHEGLLADRQVKIKGFGTFKLQTVKERSSVNVNTGERVTISEHDRITFTPDNVMRDIINKPFAQFETVVVEEGSPLLAAEYVVPEDTETIPVTEVPGKEEPETVDEAVNETVDEAVNETVDEAVETPPKIAETKEDVESKEETEEEGNNMQEPVESSEYEESAESGDDSEAEEEAYETCEHQRSECRSIFIYYGVLINVVVALAAFAAGYFVAIKTIVGSEDSTPAVTAAVNDSQQTDTLSMDKPEKPAEKPVAKPAEEPVEKTTKPAEEPAEKPLAGYDADPRVRTGAYYIMGTAQEVTVQQGQTLASISRAYLGPDMECYMEAYNGTKDVKPGDKVKIPRLKLKKLLRK